ncbi:hypothetical protein AZE42_09226 [Rhizopogon vesiculosus]|uniref:Uncharacterized protein n=1 Tax=Rhizopogon vesiculosus TaxID=180088 RepID=A0A1J8QGP2_9AGAM|nr:hypothetical protein AZE42_09226 [Rhizopogon vesiculosus]
MLMRPVAGAVFEHKITRDPLHLVPFSGWLEKLETSTNDVQLIRKLLSGVARSSSLDPPNGRGSRPQLLTTEIREDLYQLITKFPPLFLDEILDYLAVMHGVFLSQTALHDNLHDLGLTRKMVQRNAAERDEDARSACGRILQLISPLSKLSR